MAQQWRPAWVNNGGQNRGNNGSQNRGNNGSQWSRQRPWCRE
jgi:hypothetical protein